MSERGISSAVIRRLPRYYRYLGELLENNVVRISSKELSIRMKVTASQIRQDLNNFGGFGQQGYGYNVEYLFEEIGKILGLIFPRHRFFSFSQTSNIGIRKWLRACNRFACRSRHRVRPHNTRTYRPMA